MAIQNRTVTIKDIFAKNANTTIPNPPVVGTSYRNENLTAAEVGEGWPFKEIVDSAKFNEAMYEYTTICKLLETYGFLPWSTNTDYETGSLCLGTNGVIYQAKQATGPATTAKDPVTDTTHTYWQDFVGSNYVDLTSTQEISGTKTFTSTLYNKKNNPAIVLQHTGVTKGTTPSENEAWVVANCDSVGAAVANRLAAIGNVLSVLNNNSCFIRAYKNVSGSTDAADVGVVYPASGSPYAYAPAGGNISNTILTHIEGATASSSGYFELGNGWILQRGYVNVSVSGEQTVTFPKAFSSATSYCIVKNYGSAGSNVHNDREASFYSLTTTSAKTWATTDDTSRFWWFAIGR